MRRGGTGRVSGSVSESGTISIGSGLGEWGGVSSGSRSNPRENEGSSHSAMEIFRINENGNKNMKGILVFNFVELGFSLNFVNAEGIQIAVMLAGVLVLNKSL